MTYENYKTDADFEKNIYVGHTGYPLRIKKLFGYIYRGDHHPEIFYSTNPKFYGSSVSASDYTSKNDEKLGEKNYMKRFTTMRKLNIVDFSNVNNNFTNILSFLEKVFVKNETNDVSTEKKMMVLLLQICYGIILDNTVKTYGLEKDIIIKYLQNKGISDTNIAILFLIINAYTKHPNIISSRCGIRPLDKLVVKLAKKYLQEYKIDGILYVNNNTTDNDKKLLLCNILSLYYSGGTMCPPTEVCIFNPQHNLGAMEVWEKNNGNFIYMERNFKRNIKKKYKKMSTYDFYKLSKKYSKDV